MGRSVGKKSSYQKQIYAAFVHLLLVNVSTRLLVIEQVTYYLLRASCPLPTRAANGPPHPPILHAAV